jgi:hypothetical protein
LNGGNGGGELAGVFCSFSFVSSLDLPFFFGFGIAQHLFQHENGGAFGAGAGGGELGWRGEDAEVGVDCDFFYGLCVGLGCGSAGSAAGCGLRFGEVEAGDLEAVEEEAGAAGVDVVGGDALEDLTDGGLDGGSVFRQRKVEGGAAAAALARVGHGFSGGVVVVAEVFAAEAWAGAAASVGEDVAALVLLRCFVGVVHRCPSPRGTFLCKVFGRKDLSLDFAG